MQSLSSLLQNRNGQLLAECQAQSVAAVAHLPMGAPGSFGNTALMMCRKVALLANKTKGRLLAHPGEPLLRLRLKGEDAACGADDHIASLGCILDTRNDMSGLGKGLEGHRGSGTRARSRRGWFEGMPSRLGRLELEQGSELRDLLLQREILFPCFVSTWTPSRRFPTMPRPKDQGKLNSWRRKLELAPFL